MRFQLENISGGFIFIILLGKYEKKNIRFRNSSILSFLCKKKCFEAEGFNFLRDSLLRM